MIAVFGIHIVQYVRELLSSLFLQKRNDSNGDEKKKNVRPVFEKASAWSRRANVYPFLLSLQVFPLGIGERVQELWTVRHADGSYDRSLEMRLWGVTHVIPILGCTYGTVRQCARKVSKRRWSGCLFVCLFESGDEDIGYGFSGCRG